MIISTYALPILKSGYCWRVGNGSSIRVQEDRWIPINHPTNKILFPANDDIGDLLVSDLIDTELHGWRSELILDLFQREDAEAICRIPFKSEICT